jgi:hypothetical protein
MHEHEFAKMFVDEAFGPRSPSTVEWQSTMLNGTPIEVRFASEDEVMLWLIPIVQ